MDVILNWYLSLYKLGTPRWFPSRGVLRVVVTQLHQSSSHLLGPCVAGLDIRAKYITSSGSIPPFPNTEEGQIWSELLGPAGILFFRIL